MPAESSVKSEGSGERSPPRRPRRTQAERVAESDGKLLSAALRLIGERGYRGTSLAAIGEAAGYSRGLVHERFGSKAGLLWALVERILRIWNRDGRELGLAGLTGLDALAGMVDNHRRAVEEGRGIRAFYALMFEAFGPTPELVTEFRELHRVFRADIERAIREGVDAGTIRADVDAPAQAALLLGALRGLAFQALLDPDGIAIAAAYEAQKQNLRRVLSP